MSVKLDTTVVFQITGHLNGAFPATAGGILLGTGPEEREDGEVHVTESFPLPHNMVEGSGAQLSAKETQKYVSSMVSKLVQVGADKHVEGWYLSSSVGAIYDAHVFDNLWDMHKKNPESFLLVNDVALSRASGTTNLRAFRLSPEFVALRTANPHRITTEQLVEHGVDYRNLLQEVSVVLNNSVLVHRFAQHYLTANPEEISPSDQALRVPDQKVLETRGDAAMDTIDDLNYEQGNYNYYQRQLVRERQKVSAWQQKRRGENAVRLERFENGEPDSDQLPLDEWKSLFAMPEEPNRLENLLLSAQLDEHTAEIEDLAGATSATTLATKFV